MRSWLPNKLFTWLLAFVKSKLMERIEPSFTSFKVLVWIWMQGNRAIFSEHDVQILYLKMSNYRSNYKRNIFGLRCMHNYVCELTDEKKLQGMRQYFVNTLNNYFCLKVDENNRWQYKKNRHFSLNALYIFIYLYIH